MGAFRKNLDWALGPERPAGVATCRFSGVASFLGSRDALAERSNLLQYGLGHSPGPSATPQVVPINSVAAVQIIATVPCHAMEIDHTCRISAALVRTVKGLGRLPLAAVACRGRLPGAAGLCL